MRYNVSIVHGGTFENVEAPLSIDITSFQGIVSALEEIAGLKDMRISHRGKILKPTDRLPPDGARLFVSGSSTTQEEMEVEFPIVTQEEMNKAKNLIKTYGSSRNPIRHDFNTLASEMMRSVYKNYPKLARKDPIGAQICVSAGKADGSLFIDCLNKELYKKHPLIQFVLMEIAKKTRESASSFAQNAGIDPAIMPQILAHSAPPHMRPGLQRANLPAAQRAPAGGSAASITQDMLSQALAGALQNPLLAPNANAAAAASSSGTSLNNQTSDETANALATNMAAQIEAMNKKIEEGMAQLRDMGIMQQTTEDIARAILRRSGGNVERAVQLIFETMQ